MKFCWESVTLRVLDVLLFSTEIQMEPLVPNVINYYTSQEVCLVVSRLNVYKARVSLVGLVSYEITLGARG